MFGCLQLSGIASRGNGMKLKTVKVTFIQTERRRIYNEIVIFAFWTNIIAPFLRVQSEGPNVHIRDCIIFWQTSPRPSNSLDSTLVLLCPGFILRVHTHGDYGTKSRKIALDTRVGSNRYPV